MGITDPHSDICTQPHFCLCSENPHTGTPLAHLQTLTVCSLSPLLSLETKTCSARRETLDRSPCYLGISVNSEKSQKRASMALSELQEPEMG